MSSTAISLGRRSFLKSSSAASLLGFCAVTKPAMASEIKVPDFSSPTAEKPIRINFNENALGMSPKAKEAARMSVDLGNRYAKAEINKLHARIASDYHVPSECILLTDGSSEGIRSFIDGYSKLPKVQLVIPELTYGDGEHFAKLYNIPVKKVPMLANWEIDLEGLKKASTGFDGLTIIYLVNPNNPTATVVDHKIVEDWVRSKPAGVVFISDEAYSDYVADPKFRSLAPLVKEGLDNVVVLKTFSKLFAMAGMRVGYAVGSPAVIKTMKDHVAGEKLNYCGVNAALVSLDDKEFIEFSKEQNLISRKILSSTLDDLGVKYLPSNGNFMFFELSEPIAQFQKKMLARNVIVGRPFPPAMNWCRISLGTPSEMAYVAGLLKGMRTTGAF